MRVLGIIISVRQYDDEQGTGMRDKPTTKAFMRAMGWLDYRRGWDRFPKPIAILVLLADRMTERRHNLVDPGATPVVWGPEPVTAERPSNRSTTGHDNDTGHPAMGSAGSIFGRNVPVADTVPQDVLSPNPRVVSEELLARKSFIPATTLNLLAASWLQFEVHDWLSHGLNEPTAPFEVPLSANDTWTYERPMRVERTMQGPPTTDGRPPTYRNTETHWWDASQVYGSTHVVEDMLRTRKGGKLHLTPEQVLPFNPAKFPLGKDVNLAGVAGNWWVGQAMFHTLFMREHNTICDYLATRHPEWNDDQLFDHARLINAAQIAKIHTIEWTPALLDNPVLDTAMHANWAGLFGPRIKRLLGRVNLGEVLSGIAGSPTYQHEVAYAITEEFVAVYRMHPLIPDDYSIRAAADNTVLAETTFESLAGVLVDDVLEKFPMRDLFYSFGTSHPGAITLHNFPNALRHFTRPDGVTIDLATYDIVRSRERGVPRYNEFRRKFHLRPSETFEDFSSDPIVVADLRRVYRTPDDVDLMIGLYCEDLPPGFAFSDTAFRVFALMASRRLKSDRFFTYDYTPEVYTKEGIEWVESATLAKVLLRHYPELAPALEGVANGFAPWKVSEFAPVDPEPESMPLRWRLRRGFWARFMTFKYHHQEPTEIPVPRRGGRALRGVTLSSKYRAIPIDGLLVADHVPKDEAQTPKKVFSRFQGQLDKVYSLNRKDLPPVATRASDALRDAYPPRYAACFPTPERPADLGLARMAVASPYASYLRAVEGGFRWDLSGLSRFEIHAGLVPLGAIVDFELERSTRQLKAVRIETALGMSKPDSATWAANARLAMCSVTTHASLVRHFNWLHLTCGGPLAMATRNRLSAEHPVRRFLWPHVFGTQYSNDIVTPILLGKGGEFESVFSYTDRGLGELFESTTGEFDLGWINPITDAARRGVSPSELDLPAQENRAELFTVFRDHARRYLSIYYPSDDEIAEDAELCVWAEELHRRIPGGLGSFGGAALGFDSAANLLATFVYLATVEHEIVGSGLWDYQLWNDVSPVRMYADRRRVPVDVYQRLVNSNFNLNVHRTPLTADFSKMALDANAARAFQRFRDDLHELQNRLAMTPSEPWRMEPRRLKANINA